jgi:hypothetical protein
LAVLLLSKLVDDMHPFPFVLLYDLLCDVLPYTPKVNKSSLTKTCTKLWQNREGCSVTECRGAVTVDGGRLIRSRWAHSTSKAIDNHPGDVSAFMFTKKALRKAKCAKEVVDAVNRLSCAIEDDAVMTLTSMAVADDATDKVDAEAVGPSISISSIAKSTSDGNTTTNMAATDDTTTHKVGAGTAGPIISSGSSIAKSTKDGNTSTNMAVTDNATDKVGADTAGSIIIISRSSSSSIAKCTKDGNTSTNVTNMAVTDHAREKVGAWAAGSSSSSIAKCTTYGNTTTNTAAIGDNTTYKVGAWATGPSSISSNIVNSATYGNTSTNSTSTTSIGDTTTHNVGAWAAGSSSSSIAKCTTYGNTTTNTAAIGDTTTHKIGAWAAGSSSSSSIAKCTTCGNTTTNTAAIGDTTTHKVGAWATGPSSISSNIANSATYGDTSTNSANTTAIGDASTHKVGAWGPGSSSISTSIAESTTDGNTTTNTTAIGDGNSAADGRLEHWKRWHTDLQFAFRNKTTHPEEFRATVAGARAANHVLAGVVPPVSVQDNGVDVWLVLCPAVSTSDVPGAESVSQFVHAVANVAPAFGDSIQAQSCCGYRLMKRKIDGPAQCLPCQGIKSAIAKRLARKNTDCVTGQATKLTYAGLLERAKQHKKLIRVLQKKLKRRDREQEKMGESVNSVDDEGVENTNKKRKTSKSRAENGPQVAST